MSGGSWDYCYLQLNEISERLQRQQDPHRKALGELLGRCSIAMRDIEWVDSGDCSAGHELAAIQDCLKFDSTAALKQVLKDELDRLDKFRELLK